MSETNYTTPDAPHAAVNGPSVMTTPETLANIFFEPGETFAALRERPRFLVAALIIVLLSSLAMVLFFQKVSYDQFVREAFERNPRVEQMSPEQKEQAMEMQTRPVFKALAYGAPAVSVIVIILAGGALYMLGAALMGGKMSFKQGLSVWAYSSFPPAILATVLFLVLLLLKSPDDMDFSQPGGGLVVTNLAVLVGSEGSAILRAALRWFDLFSFYGMFLAAVGLRKVARISSGGAWTIVIALWLLGMLAGIGRAALFG